MAETKPLKLTFTPLESSLQPVSVMFNPNTYSIVKPVTWRPPQPPTGSTAETERLLNAPTLVFGGGGSRVLSLELLFDVTEPIDGVPIEDVRVKTAPFVALTRIEPKKTAPPVCNISWGDMPANSDFPFTRSRDESDAALHAVPEHR